MDFDEFVEKSLDMVIESCKELVDVIGDNDTNFSVVSVDCICDYYKALICEDVSGLFFEVIYDVEWNTLFLRVFSNLLVKSYSLDIYGE